jgi:hypothetical protein
LSVGLGFARKRKTKDMRWLLLFQGIYFLLAALWPFIHLRSFLAVTGDKTDIWLLKTVSVLLIAAGLTLLAAAYASDFGLPVLVLSITSATAMAAIDFYYAIRGTIRRVYLIDGMIEILIIAAVGMLA